VKFVTEMELRSLYKTAPFAVYVLEPASKLTPGARQFLTDRRIVLEQAEDTGSQAVSCKTKPPVAQGNWSILKLRSRMEGVHSLFLLTAAEVLHAGDIALSEEVLAAARGFRSVQQAELDQLSPEISQQVLNHSESRLDICDFHVGLKNGKVILLLHHLRASLQELEPVLQECYWSEDQQSCIRQDLVDGLNQISTVLYTMMKKCLGGQQWNP
jgi:ethanolamine utilization cobalamin adenosyltransferase